MSRHRPIDPLRFVLMNLLIAAIAVGLILGVGALPGGMVGVTLAFLAGLVLTPVLASPLEWIVHRYVYHRVIVPFLRPIYDVHHKGHHYVFFPTSRYVTGGPPRRIPVLGDDHFRHVHTAGWKNGLVRLAHFSFYMTIGAVFIWLPAWLLTGNVPFLIGIIVASVIVSDLFITVHDTIHRPGSHRILESQFWFKFLDNHHYIHHVDTEANVNFLLPLADWMFGTLRLTMTEAELARHGTLEAAKAKVVGMGEAAHQH
jgi:hypothetical protein